MKSPMFDEQGVDAKTYAPFTLQNCLATEWKDVRLSFNDWDWLHEKYGGDEVDDYYLNGYGVEGLVKAVLFKENFDLESDDIDFNSEGDTCFIHFKKLDEAVKTAELVSSMIGNAKLMKKMIKVAQDEGFED
jgi:hypothetical protein